MNTELFLKKLKSLKDKQFQQDVAYACGKVNPLTDEAKFRNMHKDTVNVKKIMMKAIINYFTYCTRESVTKYPNNVIKQVSLELELKKKALPLLKTWVSGFVDISDATICKMGCKTFGCHYDHPGEKICDK